MALKKDYLVQKRNVLNEIRANNMTPQEIRFFSIYLAKINKSDLSTRVVRFPLAEFQRIMEFDLKLISSKIKAGYIKNVTNSLLCKVVNIPDQFGGYTGFQLFKECTVSKSDNGNGEWFVEIDAHDKALPLMFEFKKEFFSYQLWNALKLRSVNQIRMYEILKQYEKSGERTLSVIELRELLGIGKDEYPQWERFRVRVLESCQKALSESTDIKFNYEPDKKRGPGGKILKLKFLISKNEDYIDQLTLEEFIAMKDDDNPEPETLAPRNKHDELIDLLSDACDNEFTQEEMEIVFGLVVKACPSPPGQIGLEHADYLRQKYLELKYRASKEKITRRFGYLKRMIETEALS